MALCSTKRIAVIFGMTHAHNSHACKLMRHDHRICVSSVIFSRDSGENFGINCFLSIFRRKINGKFYSTKRIGVIYGMAHPCKSHVCSLMQQGYQMCVSSVYFA